MAFTPSRPDYVAHHGDVRTAVWIKRSVSGFPHSFSISFQGKSQYTGQWGKYFGATELPDLANAATELSEWIAEQSGTAPATLPVNEQVELRRFEV